MITNFTLRDFFTFILVGVIFMLSIGLIFYSCLMEHITKISQYTFFLSMIFVCITYLLGHFIGIILLFFHKISKFINNKRSLVKNCPRLVRVLNIILISQRVDYFIEKRIKNARNYRFFSSVDGFYICVAILQKEQSYNSAEYWFLQNEFSHSLSIGFGLSSIIALIACHWLLFAIYAILCVAFYFRSEQFAHYFIETVIRKMKAREKINDKSQ